MNALADLAIYGFIPLALVLFAVLPKRTAVLTTVIGGWLFLPLATISLPGLPNLDKYTLVSFALALGVLLFDSQRVVRLRLGWIDLPLLGWILSAIFSSLANDLGWYDGLATSANRAILVAIPYVIGRLYFSDAEGGRSLLRGCLVGGVVYLLPVAYEIRMSPQLHAMIFGIGHSGFEQAIRGSGYRPVVFTPHGLALSFWMAAATLAGFALWRTRRLHQLFGISLPIWITVLALTTAMCRSFGALILMGLGFLLMRRGRPWTLALLATAMLSYIVARIFGSAAVQELLDATLPLLPTERALSMQFRIDQEELLLVRAWSRPWCGWTGWYFLVPIVDEHEFTQTIISDSMWIIAFASNGLIGLASCVGMALLPCFATMWRRIVNGPGGLDEHMALAIVLVLYFGDCLANNLPNPAYWLMLGALPGPRIKSLRPGGRAGPAPEAAKPAPYRQRERLRPRNWAPTSP